MTAAFVTGAVAAAFLLVGCQMLGFPTQTVRLTGGPLDGREIEVGTSYEIVTLEVGRRKKWSRYGDSVRIVDVVEVAQYRRVDAETFAHVERPGWHHWTREVA